jgi:hypothetical protein
MHTLMTLVRSLEFSNDKLAYYWLYAPSMTIAYHSIKIDSKSWRYSPAIL